ncbi:hypothetical protein KM92DES2_10116 [uncultured Desulfovibrio sp.]|uniref:Uncharacterized protein n=1 Tax=uncultured Desulfovibrio sp. TaxID=167968 RepID=A0A212IVT8_9BACT|nr:hypothetical protein KM92DES2_10116 [uncultured Desulfovibrio sp.]
MLLQSTLPHGERQHEAHGRRTRQPASIHAPARGATSLNCWRAGQADCFNPRSRTGSDFTLLAIKLGVIPASIHAPARGATDHGRIVRQPCSRFNPRSRTGSDRLSSVSAKASASFNPRSRTGSDAGRERFNNFQDVLQSTLPHGERRALSLAHAVASHASIHAPARGATWVRAWRSE